ncbi:MAG TPA: S1 RNA-binding domain-containing protein [Xanthomonadales bacterium]|nr:S1 RNA-binding domain-containing protein [Xanthomonadales bacterium]
MASKSSRNNTPKGAGDPNSAMARLMAAHKSSFVSLKKGESVKGKLTKLTPNEILVDLGAKTEASIMEKDKNILRTILGMFKVGDTVEVNVLNPESETGQPIVSLRRFLGNNAWGKLEELQKSHEIVEVTISEVGKAGFVVTTSFGISGFLPQSHTSATGEGENVVGQKIKASVLEINREDSKVIFSQKTKMTDEDFAKATKKYKTGEKVEVAVSNITPFGLFVTLDSFEGFIHISEVSWDKVDELTSLYSQGQKIQAVIIRFDKDSKRINFSIRKLSADPFEELIEKYPVDKKVAATIQKIEDAGVTVSLGEDLEGFIKKEKIPPMTTYSKGQEIQVTVSDHDKRKHRIILTPVLKEKPIGYR